MATVGEQRDELVVAIERAEDISDVETERAVGERSLSHAAGLRWDQSVGLEERRTKEEQATQKILETWTTWVDSVILAGHKATVRHAARVVPGARRA